MLFTLNVIALLVCHISALVIAVNEDNLASKTSVKCEWSKPPTIRAAQEKYSKGKKFVEMFVPGPSKRKVFQPIPLTYPGLEDIPCTLSSMMKCKNLVPHGDNDCKSDGEDSPGDTLGKDKFAWITERQTNSVVLNKLANISFQLVDECCLNFFNNAIHCDAVKLCYETYISKQKWQQERKHRITASSCYSLFTYSQNNWLEKAKKYFNPKSFTNKFVRHGLRWENSARLKYQRHCNLPVMQTGLIISQYDTWLGGSPDGILLDAEGTPSRLLEIKCPYQGKLRLYMRLSQHADF